MPNKLFIGGIAWGTDEDGLGRAFETHGPVREVKIIKDRESGKSRGFGFVTFESENDAETARDEMNGKSLDGRELRVDWAEEKSRGPKRQRNNGYR